MRVAAARWLTTRSRPPAHVGDGAGLGRAVEAREVEQVADESLEPRRLGLDLAREDERLLDVAVGRGGLGGLGEQLDAGDRRLEFVARVGDEVAAHAVEPRPLGDVRDDRDAPCPPSSGTTSSR